MYSEKEQVTVLQRMRLPLSFLSKTVDLTEQHTYFTTIFNY